MRNILLPLNGGRTNEPEIPETHHRPSAHLSLLPLSDRSRGRATSLPIHSDSSSLSGSIWWPSSVAPAPFLLWLFDSSRVEEAPPGEDGGVRSSDTRSGRLVDPDVLASSGCEEVSTLVGVDLLLVNYHLNLEDLCFNVHPVLPTSSPFIEAHSIARYQWDSWVHKAASFSSNSRSSLRL
uniref:Uncharacterized protein n=1 Tax=Musa acuminata TaxID=4641 RepID=Q1EPJ9_MUSAC|nr:hypothetical protein MA4_25J11.32 [Musa acuminata]